MDENEFMATKSNDDKKKHLLLSHTQTDYANKMGIIIAFSAVAVQRIMFCNKMKSLGFFYGHFS